MSCSLRDVANGGFRLLSAATVVLFAALLIYFGLDNYFAQVSKDWPRTIATITENTNRLTTNRQYVTTRRGAGGGYYRTTTSVRWQVEYRYVVEGHEYTGSRIAFVGYGYEECQAVERLHGEVPVFYDPRQPSRSVVLPGVHYNPSPLLAMLLAGLGIGLVLAYKGVALLEWPFRLRGPYNLRR